MIVRYPDIVRFPLLFSDMVPNPHLGRRARTHLPSEIPQGLVGGANFCSLYGFTQLEGFQSHYSSDRIGHRNSAPVPLRQATYLDALRHTLSSHTNYVPPAGFRLPLPRFKLSREVNVNDNVLFR